MRTPSLRASLLTPKKFISELIACATRSPQRAPSIPRSQTPPTMRGNVAETGKEVDAGNGLKRFKTRQYAGLRSVYRPQASINEAIRRKRVKCGAAKK